MFRKKQIRLRQTSLEVHAEKDSDTSPSERLRNLDFSSFTVDFPSYSKTKPTEKQPTTVKQLLTGFFF